ncbi:hypothetical protein HK102_005095 [Quaeritorhiza haematococci]|nr:hypothetical protein HK102_005095 [Quaeritorhiza haematococci]
MATTKAVSNITKDLLFSLAGKRMTPVSLKVLFNVGNKCVSKGSNSALLLPAQFLHEELPIRYMQSLKMLTDGGLREEEGGLVAKKMAHCPSFRKMAQSYMADMQMLMELPKPDTPSREEAFTDALRDLQKRQSASMSYLGQGFKELFNSRTTTPTAPENPSSHEFTPEETAHIQRFFDRFYTINMGARLLIAEHISLHDKNLNLVQLVSPLTVAQRAIEHAKHRCTLQYPGITPPHVEIHGRSASVDGNDLKTLYIEEHLRWILVELLKNGMRATMQTHGIRSGSSSLPPLRLAIVEGSEDVAFKLSDEGGGIPQSMMSKIWSYTYTPPASNFKPQPVEKEKGEDEYVTLPMSGFGHGLPLSRIMARYFGGDLELVSMEGYGTDAYLYLFQRDTAYENIPETTKINTPVLESKSRTPASTSSSTSTTSTAAAATSPSPSPSTTSSRSYSSTPLSSPFFSPLSPLHTPSTPEEITQRDIECVLQLALDGPQS